MSQDPPPDLSELDSAAQGALLRQLIGGSLDAMVTIDDGGRVLEFNPAAEALFGYRRDGVLGRPLSDLIVPPEHREAHSAGLARYLETRRSKILGRRLELEALRADASRIPIELTVLPTRVGQRTWFTAFVRDLSERKAREQELQRARDAAESSLAAQSAFLASMSHELRTPLTAIIGYADLLKRGLDRSREERGTWLGHVLRNADHLLTLLNDLLDL
ncbi:MAG TPA: histidine kinase, partial [Planctomycetes bacterium]|nr:histidine kinase [Planctomycetota bacterium]